MESALHDAGSQERGLWRSHVVPSFMGGGEACRTGAGGARKGAGQHCGILDLTSVHLLCLYLSLRSQLAHLLLF